MFIGKFYRKEHENQKNFRYCEPYLIQEFASEEEFNTFLENETVVRKGKKFKYGVSGILEKDTNVCEFTNEDLDILLKKLNEEERQFVKSLIYTINKASNGYFDGCNPYIIDYIENSKIKGFDINKVL